MSNTFSASDLKQHPVHNYVRVNNYPLIILSQNSVSIANDTPLELIPVKSCSIRDQTKENVLKVLCIGMFGDGREISVKTDVLKDVF